MKDIEKGKKMRPIDADALIKRVKNSTAKKELKVLAQVLVNTAPTIEQPMQKHGRWEKYFYGKELMCSACRATFWDENGNGGSNFCPNCGAKMDGEND